MALSTVLGSCHLAAEGKQNLIEKFVCVTAIYDIGRKDRNFKFYEQNLKKLLQFKCPLVIFCDKNTYQKFQNISRDYYTQFMVQDLKNLKFYKKHYREIQKNISSQEYKTHVKNYGRPETIYPEYNVIQFSKFDFLCQVKHVLDSECYIWIDCGIPRFFKNVPSSEWPNYQKLNDKIIVQTFRETEIQAKFKNSFDNIIQNINLQQECKMSRYLIIGGTFVVPKKDVEWLKDCIVNEYNNMLNYGYLNNEQVALEFVVKNNMEKFDIKINNSNNWYNMFHYI